MKMIVPRRRYIPSIGILSTKKIKIGSHYFLLDYHQSWRGKTLEIWTIVSSSGNRMVFYKSRQAIFNMIRRWNIKLLK